jgi:hypothetical protein
MTALDWLLAVVGLGAAAMSMKNSGYTYVDADAAVDRWRERGR